MNSEINKIINILIGGEAGQGLVTVGQILAKGLVRSGYSICVTQDYQSRIRGGHNTFAIRVGADAVRAPQESIDLLVALDADTVRFHRDDLAPHGLIVIDEALDITDDGTLKVPFRTLASDQHTNIVALGVIAALLNLDEKVVAQTVADFFGKGHREATEANGRALGESYRWAGGQAVAFERLAPIAHPPQQLMMNGNEAIALGAVTAGLKFYAFYPMTPSTSIALALAGWAKEMGLIVEQAEDEIAAINMALGASFAGAPSMVGTSGGGFALMVEGVSLAAMIETPVVIVVAQRPAPATGLPTRTAQTDLEFVLHAGHGEFPRAIFSPGSIEQCFELTQKALQVADRYQGPVFILTDQFLADSYRAVAPFRLDNRPLVEPWSHEGVGFPTPYHRSAITDDGISPRLLPGLTEHLVVVDSDEHTEDGHITEDLVVRTKMVQKRLKKGEGIRAEVIPPELQGAEKPDLLLVTWGSSKGAVEEAAATMRSRGMRIATLHFPQVWPLVPKYVIDPLHEAKQVVAVEGNATGQLARLIRRETGFHIERHVLRYDGLPITPEFILREFNP
ncbi:MAG: pyruvate ferredoxin oxidoreductase [Deltaproteobacteria bacterium RBG_13_52_11]|nr:MAG: pyruvate ferredoxin oxidoreductase [Deltaproteobacteria bacterium RBG_13_52_11]